MVPAKAFGAGITSIPRLGDSIAIELHGRFGSLPLPKDIHPSGLSCPRRLPCLPWPVATACSGFRLELHLVKLTPLRLACGRDPDPVNPDLPSPPCGDVFEAV